jgi:hypothetical protein
MCAAYARASSGNVQVLPLDVGVDVHNTWTDYEWLALVNNPAVTKIIRVDPTTLLPDIPIWVAGDPKGKWQMGIPVGHKTSSSF